MSEDIVQLRSERIYYLTPDWISSWGDVRILSEERESFYVNRCVLACQSFLFSGLSSDPSIIAQEEILLITEIPSSRLRLILKHLSDGKITHELQEVRSDLNDLGIRFAESDTEEDDNIDALYDETNDSEEDEEAQSSPSPPSPRKRQRVSLETRDYGRSPRVFPGNCSLSYSNYFYIPRGDEVGGKRARNINSEGFPKYSLSPSSFFRRKIKL